MAKRWSLEHTWSPTIYQSPCEIYVYFFLIVQTVVKQVYFRPIVTVSAFSAQILLKSTIATYIEKQK